MKKDTLKSIAERAGVSITTASRVLNGSAEKHRISRQTIDLVTREADRYGYSSQIAAKSLRHSKGSIIGLLVPSVAEYHFAALSSLIIKYNKENGFSTIVADIQNDAEREKAEVSNLLSRGIEGLIVAPSSQDAGLFRSISRDIPVIQIDRHITDAPICSICSNNLQIGRNLTELLILNGHRRIACLQGISGISSNDERLKGYVDTMTEAGLEPMIYGNTFDSQESYYETLEMLKTADRPSAIVTLANGQALGVLNAISRLGLKIPDDISIVTVDDNKYMNFISPQITRAVQPLEGMARLCCRTLHQVIKGEKNGTSSITLSPMLVMGESVKNINT